MPKNLIPEDRWETHFEVPIPGEPRRIGPLEVVFQRLLNRTERLKSRIAAILGLPWDAVPPDTIAGLAGRVSTLESNQGGTTLSAHRTAATLDHPDGSVTSEKIADGAVTAVKLANGAVTPEKLAPGAAVANIGYTPLNRAGDTMVGTLTVPYLGINAAPDYRLVVDESTRNIAVYIRKTNNGSYGGILDGPTLLVENSYGSHSWGNLAEFRIESAGNGDPPNITFTAGWTSVGWAVGMAGIYDPDFVIASNRGWRFGSFGVIRLRVRPDGQLIVGGTITPGISIGSGLAGHINSSEPIKFCNGSHAQEIYVRKIRASPSWVINDANDPGDGGGFFSGNLIVNGTIVGNLNGNASTATKLQTARTISLGGALSGNASFDGSADVTINAVINAGAVGTPQLADGAVTANKLAPGASPYDLAIFYPGTPFAGALLASIAVPRNLSLQGGSVRVGTAPAANWNATIYAEGTPIGTVSVPAGQTSGTVSLDNTPTSLSAGALLRIVAPSTADPTIQDISISLQGVV